MEISGPLLALLIQFCPWYAPAQENMLSALIFPPAIYAVLEHGYGYHEGTGGGFAVWKNTPDGIKECRIFLREPVRGTLACHEFKHCAIGEFHG